MSDEEITCSQREFHLALVKLGGVFFKHDLVIALLYLVYYKMFRALCLYSVSVRYHLDYRVDLGLLVRLG